MFGAGSAFWVRVSVQSQTSATAASELGVSGQRQSEALVASVCVKRHWSDVSVQGDGVQSQTAVVSGRVSDQSTRSVFGDRVFHCSGAVQGKGEGGGCSESNSRMSESNIR